MSKYNPVYSGVWQSAHLERLTFEGKAFFVYLFSNERVRPSGIYRATDGQLMADTGLSAAKVRAYLNELSARGRIVRDGAWMFVCGYLERQPKQERLLSGVRSDLAECTSQPVLRAFSGRYPLIDTHLTDRLQPFTNPSNGFVSTEQCRAVQSRAEQSIIDGQVTVTAKRVLEFLNHKTHRHYQPTTVNLGMIVARLGDGATEDQLIGVIAKKAREWLADAKMAPYLRPATLFGREKFSQYQGELPLEVLTDA